MTPQLSRKLTLEAPTRASDGAGGFSEAWAALGVHWAEVKSGSGRVTSRGEASLSEVPTTITVRGAPVGAQSRPIPDQRFREGARVWRILAVTEADAMGRFLRCDTIEEAVA